MKVWVTRDKTKDGDVAVWVGKEKDLFLNNYGRYSCEADCDTCEIDYLYMRPRTFKKYFGFTPRKGSCKEYELTLKEMTCSYGKNTE